MLSSSEIECVVQSALATAAELGVVTNLSKLNYVVVQTSVKGHIVLGHRSLSVAGCLLPSSSEPPVVVGLPLLPGTLCKDQTTEISRRLYKVRRFIKAYGPAPILALRVLYAYGISSFDYLVQGSHFTDTSFPKLQVLINQVARTVLHLPPDTPVSLLTLPINAFGWGFPRLMWRAQVKFMIGYLDAFDSRNTLCSDLMREQAMSPSPHGFDDFSNFTSLCSMFGLSRDLPSAYTCTVFPSLLPIFAQSRTLYVVTDASLEVLPTSEAVPSRGGLGILITDGSHHQDISWGPMAVIASATTL